MIDAVACRGTEGRRHRRASWWRGSIRATCRKTMRRPRSPKRSQARACASTAPLPAAAICSPNAAGVLVVDRAPIDALNRIDEAITLATLPAYKPVVEGEMIATVKIIPFAVAGDIFMPAMKTAQACEAAGAGRALQGQEGRRGVDAAAGPVAEGDRQDAEDHRGAAGAGRRAHRRRAARAARPGRAGAGDPATSRQRAPSWSSCSAPRRSPTGAT